MQDLDEFTATDAALAQMAATPDPRLKQIADAAVRHLHAFAREVNSNPPPEWLTGIAFLTQVGKALHPCPPGVHSPLRRPGRQRRGQRPARQEGPRARHSK